MMTTRRTLFAVAFAISFTLPAAALAGPAPEQDRKSILAMAGDYRVRFDMRETVSFQEGYKPLDPKISGGFESVRVVEDRGDFISLQHILVISHDGKESIVKHWRQDWTYEPAKVLVYAKSNRWELKPVSAGERKGAWSQTVWQTDDSPRYGGVGKWTYDGGVARWQSDKTLRPLARRDAIRYPAYTWYQGTNRHALTPTGWIHEQDNAKLGEKDGKPATYVHEVVLNTYNRSSDYPAKVADAYWEKTRAYWANVRQAWDTLIATGGVTVTEEAQAGSVTGPRLMGLADEIAEGKIDTAQASAQARSLIASTERSKPLASLK
jgi:hypothetical protein